MKSNDYIAEFKKEIMQRRAENEVELDRMMRATYSKVFIIEYGRVPTDAELSRFIEQRKAREAEKRRQQAMAEEQSDELNRANAENYRLWFEQRCSELRKRLEHKKPDDTVALRKFLASEKSLQRLEAIGGLRIWLPVNEPDLTDDAKAALSTLCQNLVCQVAGGRTIGRLEEHLDWKPKSYFFPFPYAEFLDKNGTPCLLFTANLYGIIAIEISKKPSFQKNLWLCSVKDKNGHEEKVDERTFTFKAKAPYLLGYYWTDTLALGWSTESLLVPIILLDALAKGQIEVEGVKVKARFGSRTSYNVNGCDEIIEISDGFAEFLRRLKEPWYQDMEALGIIDNKTSEIVQLKLAQALSPPTAPKPAWNDDDFLAAMTSLGFTKAVANEKLKLVKETDPHIYHKVTLEEAITMALRA